MSDKSVAHQDGLQAVPMPTGIDARIREMTQVQTGQELVDELSTVIGRLQTQTIVDGMVINRLINHIRAIDPDDRLATEIEQKRNTEQ